jgi:hypothetical protein
LFKWIKQHLRIKAFYGTSENAEDPDLDCGVDLCAGGDRAQATRSGSQSLPDSTDSLFEKTPILRALQACDSDNDLFDTGNQLILFNF